MKIEEGVLVSRFTTIDTGVVSPRRTFLWTYDLPRGKYLAQCFANDILPDDGLPNCDAAYDEILSLPIYPGLTSADQDHVIAMLMEVLS